MKNENNTPTEFIVCYEQKIGHEIIRLHAAFDVFTSQILIKNGTFDITALSKIHPDWNIIAIFDLRNNIIDMQNKEMVDFDYYCYDYDFDPRDYKRKVIKPGGTIYELVGFAPHNRKYKMLLRNIITNNTVKASEKFVRRYMI